MNKPEFVLRLRHGGDFKANSFKELKLLVNGKLAEKYEGARIVHNEDL